MTGPFAHRRLLPDARARALSHVIDRLAARCNGRPGLVVFDLDGTLMDNRPRIVTILHELADHWRRPHPKAAERLERAVPDDLQYSLEDNLRHLGVDASLHPSGLEFWQRRFFHDAYLHHDVPLPGAVEFARRCHDAGAVVVYLTGRDLPNMALGTFASLRDHGFPIGVVGTELVTKPDAETPDALFKRRTAPTLERLGEVLAVFDNEPANCNAFMTTHPGSTTVFVDTLYAPDPPELHPDVTVIDSFVM